MPMLAPKQGTEWIGRRLKLRDLRILAPLPQRTDLRRWLSHASRPRHLLALGIARHHTRRAGANLAFSTHATLARAVSAANGGSGLDRRPFHEGIRRAARDGRTG